LDEDVEFVEQAKALGVPVDLYVDVCILMSGKS